MAAMEAAYTFANTITVSEITPMTSETDPIPTVETNNLEAGDYILLKVTASNWMF